MRPIGGAPRSSNVYWRRKRIFVGVVAEAYETVGRGTFSTSRT
jgi:hypothetical protein